MRVVRATRFGGPEVLETSAAPNPVAGPGQVVIGVSVGHALFGDTQIRRGWHREYFRVKPPYVPRVWVAGQVISVGKGVDPGGVGRRGVTATGECGGHAEQALAPAEDLILVPDGLGLRRAAALLHDGRTAPGLARGGPNPAEGMGAGRGRGRRSRPRAGHGRSDPRRGSQSG